MSEENLAIREALAVYAPEAPEAERVPSGYKQTEVGVIPENWEVKTLQAVEKLLQAPFRVPLRAQNPAFVVFWP